LNIKNTIFFRNFFKKDLTKTPVETTYYFRWRLSTSFQNPHNFPTIEVLCDNPDFRYGMRWKPYVTFLGSRLEDQALELLQLKHIPSI
jgi:hypothetical protein